MAQRDNILGIDAKRALITLVLAVILLVGAISLIGKAADFDEIVEALDAANREWFPICLAGLVCAYAGYIAGYREIARMSFDSQDSPRKNEEFHAFAQKSCVCAAT